MSLQNAEEDKKYAESRYTNGLISEEIFKEIDIAYKTTSTDQELSAWTLKDAKDNVRLVTGLEWNSSLIPEIPSFEASAKVEDWIAKDLTYEMALLSQKIQGLKTASLATNTSVYDRTDPRNGKPESEGFRIERRKRCQKIIRKLPLRSKESGHPPSDKG